MFATWDLTAERISENLAKGETSIDIKRRITDAMLAAKLLRAKPSLMLLQYPDYLLFVETASLHRQAPFERTR
jgi:hypothetical protein|tara:strand:+ start:450 stop:668 length:219 start_codon:yes stop_codon:yes gene_type:complete